MRTAISGGSVRKAILGGLCAAAASVIVVGCGGGGTGETSGAGGAPTAVNIAQFCEDYGDSVQLFGGTEGDTTDPDWAHATTLLGKAKAEAPDSVKPHVSKLYDIATAALKKAGSGEVMSADDFNAEEDAIAPWATTNCTNRPGS